MVPRSIPITGHSVPSLLMAVLEVASRAMTASVVMMVLMSLGYSFKISLILFMTCGDLMRSLNLAFFLTTIYRFPF